MAAVVGEVPLVVVQDCFRSPLWDTATYQLPGATFAERDGSYVNYADRLQSFGWAIRPPSGAMAEGQLYWRLLGKKGLYNARSILRQLADECSFFGAAAGDIPAVGVDLKVDQLVG